MVIIYNRVVASITLLTNKRTVTTNQRTQLYSQPFLPGEGSSQKTIVHNCSLFCQTLAAEVAALIPFQSFLFAAGAWQHPAVEEETKS